MKNTTFIEDNGQQSGLSELNEQLKERQGKKQSNKKGFHKIRLLLRNNLKF